MPWDRRIPVLIPPEVADVGSILRRKSHRIRVGCRSGEVRCCRRPRNRRCPREEGSNNQGEHISPSSVRLPFRPLGSGRSGTDSYPIPGPPWNRILERAGPSLKAVVEEEGVAEAAPG